MDIRIYNINGNLDNRIELVFSKRLRQIFSNTEALVKLLNTYKSDEYGLYAIQPANEEEKVCIGYNHNDSAERNSESLVCRIGERTYKIVKQDDNSTYTITYQPRENEEIELKQMVQDAHTIKKVLKENWFLKE